MILNSITLTDQDKAACESWLENWSFCSSHLTLKFDEESLLKLLVYETITRKRKTAIDRLFARYYKLRKERELKAIYGVVYGKQNK